MRIFVQTVRSGLTAPKAHLFRPRAGVLIQTKAVVLSHGLRLFIPISLLARAYP